MAPGATELTYDPYDPVIDADPHPVWKRLRDEAPLYRNDEHGFYALSRFDDVMRASLDWQTYSSARGTLLELIDTSRPVDPEDTGEASGMMIFMDPPPHDRLRRLVSRAFTPRRVAALESRARSLCAELLEPLRDSGGFDYLQDFAARIPSTLIGALLGVPEPDQEQLRVWADLMLRFEPDGISEEKATGLANLHEYMTEMVASRRNEPRDDMVSDLVGAEITLPDGATRRLAHHEVMAFFTLLHVAGSETTARLLGWFAVLMARHPQERGRLVSDPSLIPNAVEELLRYEAPSPIQARYVTRDVEWHGQTVPAGSKMALLTGSAGRDERKYPRADTFDVTRTFDTMATFGFGIHYCLGANLARLEAKVVLDETLARLPAWHVDEAAVEMVKTTTVRGPSHVPITF